MDSSARSRSVAIVGIGAVLPDAEDASSFWRNLVEGRSSIREVPPERWDPALYWDPDPRTPDRTYSKIGGWVTDYEWDPLGWRMPIPPKVAAAMDPTQKYAIAAARQALLDYGYPGRPLNGERTAVVLGNAMGGDYHLLSSLRILFPEVAEELRDAPAYKALPEDVRAAVLEELRAGVSRRIPDITEDTMPGELSNITAGRIAAIYDFRGPNFVTDAACASAIAALYAAIDGLENGDYDAVLAGGADANMSPSAFVKFSKIGALSATGSRPYAEGANGFVMGEGAAIFVLKRLADAERDGDRIYAIIRGVGGSSDGRGKGITAPNPIGQQLAVSRAWKNAGLAPLIGDLIEGHGTSTRVGDVVEVTSMNEVFAGAALPSGSLMLGSVKSNIGHLKGAAGAVGMLKAALSLHHGVVPPSINFHKPNPGIDFATATLAVASEAREWPRRTDGQPRRAGVSAFGFGGTNFHVVLEQYIPAASPRVQVRGASPAESASLRQPAAAPAALKTPLRGALVIGGASEAEIVKRLAAVKADAERGIAPSPAAPARADLDAPVRLAIDYGDAAELADLAGRTLAALEAGDPGRWRALRNRGVFLGRGEAGKVAFLFTGQGSQYVNMLRELSAMDPIVAEMFEEADRVMQPLIGSTLTSRIFLDAENEAAMAEGEEALKQTAITQPAVLTVDTSLARLMTAYGVEADMVMGHSLGEYGALVAVDAMPFGHALKAVSARGEAMTHLAMEDNGLMAAVFGDVDRVREVIEGVDGYVVIANFNSTKECVIGGGTTAVEAAMEALREAGMRAQALPVSHAFHTDIVAKASGPLVEVLRGLSLRPPRRPVVANVNGEFYPTDGDVVESMLDILGRQVGSPVQFVKGLETLYQAGARVFIEMGPKRVLYALVEDVLGDRDDVTAVYTNHPRNGDVVSFNRALCAAYAAGLGHGAEAAPARATTAAPAPAALEPAAPAVAPAPAAMPGSPVAASAQTAGRPSMPAVPRPASSAAEGEDRYVALGRLFADFLDRSFETWSGGGAAKPVRVGITGAALGLPGGERVFDERNLERILRGDALIGSVPAPLRVAMAGRQITRLVKGPNGEARFETIDDPAEVIKLAGHGGEVGLVEEFGFPEDRLAALDRVTRLAIAAGLDALRDAGMPLVMRHKTTTTGSRLPDGWGLPESMRDDTGVIFASAFPGYDSFARVLEDYHADHAKRERLEELESLRAMLAAREDTAALAEIDERIAGIEAELKANPFRFDRRFLFQVLNMGHSQFAEYIGARGPNIGTNGACASGTQATALARDWIAAGRCRRVIVLSADDITTDTLLPWFGAGFLASGAAATDERIEDAALPFDRRRHGLIIGMGGAALVVESLDAAAERGLSPICEVLGTVVANSAFHGSRLDVNHIAGVMERLVSDAERQWGIDRRQIAGETVFVSHETYTPARGGSASAEVVALRSVFGEAVDRIVVANTKGHTGHPMAVGIEDALAVRMLETGVVPPVANFREVDPELGTLNLSRGGSYPVRYALRLAAGFGSQIAMSLMRWTPPPDGARRRPDDVGFEHRIADRAAWDRWLAGIAGAEGAGLEIAKRVLRVHSDVVPNGNGGAVHGVPLEIPAPAMMPTVSPAAPAAVSATGGVATVGAAPAGAETPVGAASAAPAAASDPVRDRVLGIVAEQTGYPPDMLDLDLDLEADLGIDTVKQAEMFAAIRDAYDIERDEDLALRDYPTLARAIEFVYEKRPDLAPPAAPASAADAPVAASSSSSSAPAAPADAVRDRVLGIVAEQTGYPPDMLDLDLDLEADLGIDTVKQAEMFAAIRDAYDIERDEDLALRDYPTLARAIEFVYEKRPDLVPAAGAPPAVSAPAAPVAAPASAVDAPGTVASSSAPVAMPADEPVRATILRIVAEQTGYPADMLELDLDLEADLGIDTVKQAEMFAAIREEYDIERDEEVALRDYPTLARAIEFVYEKRPDLAPAAAASAGAPASAAGAPDAVAPSSAPVAMPADEPVRATILRIVAEQTGYPADMLELELDLEADLGIDTVKQAEMFAAIREEYDIERDEEVALRDYPTLARAIEFVYEKRPDLAPGAAAPAGAVASAAAGSSSPESAAPSSPQAALAGITGDMAAAQALPRRVPVPCIRPDLEVFRETGVKLAEGDRVVVMPDAGGVAKSLVARLKKLGVTALVVDGAPDAGALAERLAAWRAEGPIRGLYWLPALDTVEEEMLRDAAARREVVRLRVKLLYTTLRTLYDDLGGAGAFVLSATRLGGRHGYDDAGAADVPGGAVTGLVKSFARERPDALVKAVDFAPSRKTAAPADLLIEETLRDPGVVEVGYADDRRWTVGLDTRPIEPGDALPGADGVWVVTGAAGSITSAILTDLAVGGGEFWLLDLTPEPDPSDADLARLITDREGLKRDVFARLKAAGERATPALVEKELARMERSAAALAAIRAVESAGGTAHWRALDLRDTDAVAAVVAEVLASSGRVDALVHAAGLEISRSLPDKSPEEFDLVFDVKTEGWFNLMAALGDEPLGAAVVFSSIAGRFGNAGQADYSAANDLLCKAVSSFRNRRPEARGVAVDWTAWGGIGMASRGSIPAIMKAAGIDMLEPAAGIPVVRRELSAAMRGEVVVAGSLGIMLADRAPVGGLDPEILLTRSGESGPMVARVVGVDPSGGLVVETELDPAAQPFLNDHRIDGTAVLPGVMGIEAMAEAARLAFPELRVAGIEDVRFLAPFKFYRDEPRTVTVRVVYSEDGDDLVAGCELLGSRVLHGRPEPEVITHFTARVRLTSAPAGKPAVRKVPTGEQTVGAAAIYDVYFHGAAYRVLDGAWRAGELLVGSFAAELPSNHEPADRPTLAAPRLIELAFQTAGLAEIADAARMGLPRQVDRVVLANTLAGEQAGTAALLLGGDVENGYDLDVVDGKGRVLLSIRGYRTAALPGEVEQAAFAPVRAGG